MSEKKQEIKYPENQRIINRMEEEINGILGASVWNSVTDACCPNGNMDSQSLNIATQKMLERLDALTDEHTLKKIFSNVRHALKHTDFAWAREKFLQYGDIDLFADAVLQDSTNRLTCCAEQGETFYGQPITYDVLEYAKNIKDLFYGKRTGNKITATAIPFMAQEYLSAKDDRTRRYHACHCPFAKESILADKTVSKTLCFCSLGHTKVFWEAALDTNLDGDILKSALNGDASCQFVIFLPDDIMEKYVKTIV